MSLWSPRWLARGRPHSQSTEVPNADDAVQLHHFACTWKILVHCRRTVHYPNKTSKPRREEVGSWCQRFCWLNYKAPTIYRESPGGAYVPATARWRQPHGLLYWRMARQISPSQVGRTVQTVQSEHFVDYLIGLKKLAQESYYTFKVEPVLWNHWWVGKCALRSLCAQPCCFQSWSYL